MLGSEKIREYNVGLRKAHKAENKELAFGLPIVLAISTAIVGVFYLTGLI